MGKGQDENGFPACQVAEDLGSCVLKAIPCSTVSSPEGNFLLKTIKIVRCAVWTRVLCFKTHSWLTIDVPTFVFVYGSLYRRLIQTIKPGMALDYSTDLEQKLFWKKKQQRILERSHVCLKVALHIYSLKEYVV